MILLAGPPKQFYRRETNTIHTRHVVTCTVSLMSQTIFGGVNNAPEPDHPEQSCLGSMSNFHNSFNAWALGKTNHLKFER